MYWTELHAFTLVRGHEKVPVCGQVQVAAGGQLKVPIPRVSCPVFWAPGGDGGGAIQSPRRPGGLFEICEGTYGHHRCLP
jgi:hypothetical protein